MRPREHCTVGQSSRQLCQLPSLRQEAAVVRRKPTKMDRSATTKIAAAAIALIIKGLNLPGQTAPSTVEPDTWQFSEQGIHTQGTRPKRKARGRKQSRSNWIPPTTTGLGAGGRHKPLKTGGKPLGSPAT